MAVSEQPTILSRIGNWFRRSRTEGVDAPTDNDNGHAADVFDPGLGGMGSTTGGPGNGGMLPTGPEPRSTFLRPWAKRDAAIEQLQSGVGALAELMTGIRDNLERTAKRQDELVQYLSHLPGALQQLPESARVQGEALKAIQLRMERQSEEQGRLADVLERMSQADQVHGRTLDALQERVDTLNEHDKAIAENLNGVGSAMKSLSQHSENSVMVLKQIREDTTTRDGELERILHRQGHRFTTMLAIALVLSISALAAVGVVGYLLLNQAK
jgi:chromosome segregation ATPase